MNCTYAHDDFVQLCNYYFQHNTDHSINSFLLFISNGLFYVNIYIVSKIKWIKKQILFPI